MDSIRKWAHKYRHFFFAASAIVVLVTFTFKDVFRDEAKDSAEAATIAKHDQALWETFTGITKEIKNLEAREIADSSTIGKSTGPIGRINFEGITAIMHSTNTSILTVLKLRVKNSHFVLEEFPKRPNDLLLTLAGIEDAIDKQSRENKHQLDEIQAEVGKQGSQQQAKGLRDKLIILPLDLSKRVGVSADEINKVAAQVDTIIDGIRDRAESEQERYKNLYETYTSVLIWVTICGAVFSLIVQILGVEKIEELD